MAIEQSIISIESRVDLRALRAVVAVADSGSFRQAADDLGYTQSAISHQVATLERALGTKFFSRPGGRGKVMLTPAGQAVCRRGRRALGEVDALGSDVEEAVRGQRLVIRVGVGQTTASELMPGALRAFRQVHPDVGVVLSEVTEGEAIMNALARGRLDLAFAADPDPDERIEALPIGADPWVILTRRDSPLAGAPDPSFNLLDGADLVAWTRHWRAQVWLEEELALLGVAPRIVYRTDDNLALQRMVAAGLGHACLGLLAARHAVDPALTWLIPRESVRERRYWLCYSRRRALSPTVQALASVIRAETRL